MKFDIVSFLKYGKFLNFGQDTVEDIIMKQIGLPDEIEDYGCNGKYLHYGNVRFSIVQGFLNSIDIFFIGEKAKYDLNFDDNNIILSNTTPLTALIYCFNKWEIKWSISYENSNLDYLVVETKSGIRIYFHLESNQVDRVSRLWNF